MAKISASIPERVLVGAAWMILRRIARCRLGPMPAVKIGHFRTIANPAV